MGLDPRSPGTARRLVTEWLNRGNCGPETTQDLVLAVNEAVTNSVEHANPPGREGIITVDAIAEDNPPGATRAVVTVTDTGQWRPPSADPGFRGRGLAMMQALVHRLHIERTSTGTQVRMTSHSCGEDNDTCSSPGS